MRRLATALLLCAFAGTTLAVDRELEKLAKDPDSFKRSDAARALGADGSPEAAKLLLELLADRNSYTRDHTVGAVGKMSDPEALEVIAKAAKDRDALLRRNAAAALGATKVPEVLPVLRKLALDDKEPAVRVEALDALWEFRGSEEAAAIAREAYGDDEASVRAAAVEAIGRVRAPDASDVCIMALEDPDVGVRCVAHMELRYVDEDAAHEHLSTAAESEHWRLRAQAVEDALHLRTAPAVDVLVARIADEQARVSSAAHRGLMALTGKQLGRDADLWRGWWEQNRETWKPPRGRLDDIVAERNESERRTAAFQGVELDSGRLVFVLDASGSMRDPMPKATDGKTRWEYVRDELLDTLADLPDETIVQVVLFQEDCFTPFDEPQDLSRRNRGKVEKFLGKITPGDRGDLLAGMRLALDQEGTDTVILLSDGAPSYGEHVLKHRVSDVIRRWNRTRKRAIHTIAFGSKRKSETNFMRDVARDAGGRMVER